MPGQAVIAATTKGITDLHDGQHWPKGLPAKLAPLAATFPLAPLTLRHPVQRFVADAPPDSGAVRPVKEDAPRQHHTRHGRDQA